MSAAYLTGIAAHLWQSTLFVVVIGVLALFLRNNRAAVRYAMWLTASAKFLIPFSLFVEAGHGIGWRTTIVTVTPAFSQAIEEAFVPVRWQGSTVSVTPAHNIWPLLLLCAWAAGSLVVLFTWWRQWHPIQVALRHSQPVSLDLADSPMRLEARSCADLREPGIVGIRRPIFLVPAGIDAHLNRSELSAIVAHEICHVRRRDNLGAALHMVVQALFWFHPFVWWLEARLVVERERACDEEVLSGGTDPRTYAEAILKVCRLYVETPLLCAAGVTGSNLTKRIEAIMRNDIRRPLDAWRRFLLASAATAVILGPVVVGVLNAPRLIAQSVPPSVAVATQAANGAVQWSEAFVVASIKRTPGVEQGSAGWFPGGRFRAHSVTLREMIAEAYRVQGSQLIGAPDWVAADHFEIEAKADDDPPPTRAGPDPVIFKRLQGLLADRFKLRVHHETRDLPVFGLVMAKSGATGPRLHQQFNCPPIDLNDQTPKPFDWYCGGIRVLRPGVFHAKGATMAQLAKNLSPRVGRIVVDRTGLIGDFDLDLEWVPTAQAAGVGATGDSVPADGVSIFTALQEQLGLKLQAIKAPIDVLVIDHAEPPTEN